MVPRPVPPRGAAALFLGAALLLPACSQPETEGAPRGTDAIVVELWDGESLDGWTQAGPGAFQVVDGALMATGGMGLLWYSEEEFVDFMLELEWKTEDDGDNAGVFVRFPNLEGKESGEWVAVHEGYEIQICDTVNPMHDTGSVYSFQGTTKNTSKGPGEWNAYRITVVGQQYTIELNGEVINEFTGERGERGHVGLQNHDDDSPVRFRNLRVTKL